MNGECFSMRGNDISPVCSCPEGTLFDSRTAVCEPDARMNATNIVVVRRTRSRILFLEQRGSPNLTRGISQFPSRWVCDTENRFCRATDRGVYYNSFDIDSINTDDSVDTYLRYSDVLWKCTDGKVAYRRNDDGSTDPDRGDGFRAPHENCVTPAQLCNSMQTGVESQTQSGKCDCISGWTGPTCQSRLALDISRPVRPSRSCIFPSNSTCDLNELCFFWESTTTGQRVLPPSSITTQNHTGWCWCGMGFIPASTDPTRSSVTADACVRTPLTAIYGVPAIPYTPRSPSYALSVDHATRQNQHYMGQGYHYASIAPYPLPADPSYMRINDTMADEPGYLWRCDPAKAVYNASLSDCVFTSTFVSPAISAEKDAVFSFEYTDCDSPGLFGPECAWNSTVCRTERCNSRGWCTGTHQGCDCERGWGGYNCSTRVCGPNLVDDPPVFACEDFECSIVRAGVSASLHPHVFNWTTEKCNCSVHYTGIYCESYRCGNKATLFDRNRNACNCTGFAQLNTTTGTCTNNTCPEFRTKPDIENPYVCVYMMPEETDPRGANYGQDVPITPGDDDRYIHGPYSMDPEDIAVVSLGLLNSAAAAVSWYVAVYFSMSPPA